MLERIEHANGVVIYRSPRLAAAGVSHAFTTRLGGVSRAPFDSLNLDVRRRNATQPTDANTAIAANFRKLRHVLGVNRVMRVEARQVHGASVWWAPEKPVKLSDAPEADALLADHSNRNKLLCIRVADCVPILLATPDGRQVAAVHAGWRGLTRGVIAAALGQFENAGDLIAAVGPCIGVKHYEVNDEVAGQFKSPDVVRDDLGPKPHVDLRLESERQLREAGVANVAGGDQCTYANEREFFSHRRDVTHQGQPATGRMAAVIRPNP